MIIPDPISAPIAERSYLDVETRREITNVSVIPFPTVEIDDEFYTFFTVPDGEYYRLTHVSYYGRSSTNLVIYGVPPGDSVGTPNILFVATMANGTPGTAELIEGHIFGPGEILNVYSGSGGTVNVKISVDRITGTI